MPDFTLFFSDLIFIVLNYFCKLLHILLGTRNGETLNMRQCLGQFLAHSRSLKYLLSEWVNDIFIWILRLNSFKQIYRPAQKSLSLKIHWNKWEDLLKNSLREAEWRAQEDVKIQWLSVKPRYISLLICSTFSYSKNISFDLAREITILKHLQKWNVKQGMFIQLPLR